MTKYQYITEPTPCRRLSFREQTEAEQLLWYERPYPMPMQLYARTSATITFRM